MSEFRYNRLLSELLCHLAREAGNMEIDLVYLVPSDEARRSLMAKVNEYLGKPFDSSESYEVARITDLAKFFARTFYNRVGEPDGQ